LESPVFKNKNTRYAPSVSMRLVLLAVAVSLLFVGYSLFVSDTQTQHLDELRHALVQNRQSELIAIQDHSSHLLQDNTDFFCDWDEFSANCNKGDTAWFVANVAPAVQSFDVDHLYAFDRTGKLAWSHSQSGEASKHAAAISGWVSKNVIGAPTTRAAGYIWDSHVLLEIACSKVRHTGTGNKDPQGYFATIRAYEGDRLKDLEGITKCKLSVTEKATLPAFYADGRYSVPIQLKSPSDGAFVATLQYSGVMPEITLMTAQTAEMSSTFLFIALGAGAFLILGIYLWVVRPLGVIERRVKGETTVPLDARRFGSREWQLMADLVERYDDQHRALIEAASEMEESNRELSELNQSLEARIDERTAELQKAYEATILGWSRAMEFRDEETEGHTQRVAEMSLRLGKHFGLDEDELHNLYIGALLHDIGKIGIPDSILLKEGKLTPEEFRVMESHTLIAQEMLEPITFLKDSMDVPLFHHEKWNGQGYPYGLMGEEIPLLARIFAVSDVWDALRSNRPYRKAWPEDRVREYIRSELGKHFDPKVVQAFLTMEPMPHPSDAEFLPKSGEDQQAA